MRPRISHGTLIAYVALFVALGGSGYAATVIATASRGGSVNVRCSASHGGRRVACKVLSGNGVGPRGPRGPQGPPGPNGAAGATSLTEPPSFTIKSATVGINGQSPSPNDEWQRFNLYAFSPVSASAPETATFQTYLLSPGELNGSPDHIASIDLCIGLQDSNLGASSVSTVAITHATVFEYEEPDGVVSSGPTPAYGATPATIFDAPLNITTNDTGNSSCHTITPSSSQPINPAGYVSLEVTASFSTPGVNGKPGTYQSWVYFGRVTTTYSP